MGYTLPREAPMAMAKLRGSGRSVVRELLKSETAGTPSMFTVVLIDESMVIIVFCPLRYSALLFLKTIARL